MPSCWTYSWTTARASPLISALRERLPRAAIVVFTGYKNPLLNEQCVRAGANAVVVKTGEIDELGCCAALQAKLRRVAPRARLARADDGPATSVAGRYRRRLNSLNLKH